MDVTTITWEALGAPATLGFVVAIITLLLTHPLIGLIFDSLWYLPADADERRKVLRERWRQMTVILSVTLCSFLLSLWRMGGEMQSVFVLTVTSVAMAISQFETAEKLVGVIFKTELQNINLFSAVRRRG